LRQWQNVQELLRETAVIGELAVLHVIPFLSRRSGQVAGTTAATTGRHTCDIGRRGRGWTGPRIAARGRVATSGYWPLPPVMASNAATLTDASPSGSWPDVAHVPTSCHLACGHQQRGLGPQSPQLRDWAYVGGNERDLWNGDHVLDVHRRRAGLVAARL
jgi:hypothetical protein